MSEVGYILPFLLQDKQNCNKVCTTCQPKMLYSNKGSGLPGCAGGSDSSSDEHKAVGKKKRWNKHLAIRACWDLSWTFKPKNHWIFSEEKFADCLQWFASFNCVWLEDLKHFIYLFLTSSNCKTSLNSRKTLEETKGKDNVLFMLFISYNSGSFYWLLVLQ